MSDFDPLRTLAAAGCAIFGRKAVENDSGAFDSAARLSSSAAARSNLRGETVAVIYCNQCGQSIADGSKFCNHCGAAQLASAATPAAKPVSTPRPRKSGSSDKVLVGIIAGAILLVIVASMIGNSTSPLQTSNLSGGGGVPENLTTPDTETNRWSYNTDVDKVRGGTTYYATTTSTNTVHQDFPYDSATTMDLTLRRSPAYGTDVILTISSGQMMCPSYEGCSGTVRFDDGPAQRIQFNGPEDSSNEVVFVVGAKGFIGKLRKAKKVVIEKTLYQAGAPQFEFDVRGLKWDH